MVLDETQCKTGDKIDIWVKYLPYTWFEWMLFVEEGMREMDLPVRLFPRKMARGYQISFNANHSLPYWSFKWQPYRIDYVEFRSNYVPPKFEAWRKGAKIDFVVFITMDLYSMLEICSFWRSFHRKKTIILSRRRCRSCTVFGGTWRGVIKIDLQSNFHGSFDSLAMVTSSPILRSWSVDVLERLEMLCNRVNFVSMLEEAISSQNN